MVQQYDSDFDAELMGRSGPPYWGFGKGRPPIGMYIEGFVVDKVSLPKTKYQTERERERGDELEYEYWVGKKLKYSTKPLEEFLKEEPQARPNKKFVLTLQTQLRDPEKGDKDDGRRRFELPRDAKGKLADALRAQGIESGLPLGAFVRVTLTELEELEGLDTPKRHYKVEVWDSGEQPSPSPAQPVDNRAKKAEPKEQQWPQQQQNVAQPGGFQQQANFQPGTQQFQQGQGQVAFQQFPENVLQMMKSQGLACPPGNEQAWAAL